MSTYISLDNLARYDLKAKARAEGLYADASAACWQKTEKAGAVTCIPAPETPLEPVVEFLFKETLPSGDKGPENPSAISGVSEVKVARCGKNLVPQPSNGTAVRNGVTFVVADGVFTATGTAGSGNAALYIAVATGKVLRVVQGHTYCLSGCPAGGTSSTYYINANIYDDNGKAITYNILRDYGSGATYTAPSNGWLTVYIGVVSGVEVSGLVFKPQIEDSTSATGFESSETTVYALPLGLTCYGGTLDVASGKLTVTQFFYSFTGEETITVTDKGDGWKCFYYRRTDVLADNSSAQTNETRKVCTHFPFVYNANQQSTHWYAQGGGNICLFSNQFADADAFKAWLAAQKQNGTPVELTFNLANPYTIQLDPVMINALPALGRTSPRINTVYTDALNVQVGYAEHPAYTEELISNAILALGGDI